MKIINPSLYTVIVGNTNIDPELQKFKETVNERLRNGWHLQGGASVNVDGAIYQAMFHYQGKDNE